MNSVRWIVVCLLCFCLSGCGGGGGLNTSPVQNAGQTSSRAGQVSLTVVWPPRTRLIPAASDIIQVLLNQGSTTLTSKLLARPTTGNTSSVSFTNVAPGNYSLAAVAYPNTSGGNAIAQAQGSTALTVVAGQTVPVTVNMASTIASLSLSSASLSEQVNSSTQIVATAKDATGNFVVTSALHWASNDSTIASVDQSGNITGVKAGTTQITVTETESHKTASLPVTVTPSTLFLYDGFAYTAGGPVAGDNGGIGAWGGPWNQYGQGYTSSVIASGGLSFGKLATSGNAIMTTSDFPVGHARPFQTSPGKVGSVLFISFLVKPLDALNVGSPDTYFELVYGGVSIGCDTSSSGFYGLEHSPAGGDRVNSTIPVVTNQTAFLVVRITFGPTNGNDTIDLFVNPTPGQPLPATPDATKTDANTGVPTDFNFGSSIRTMFDEIRFGHTFEDVSPTS